MLQLLHASYSRRQELTLELDRGPVTAIYLRRVGTFTKAVLGLLIIVSVTTILVTPDPTDDVMVILHQQHVLTAQPVLLSVIQVPLASVRLSRSDDASDVPLSADLLDLVCSRLC